MGCRILLSAFVCATVCCGIASAKPKKHLPLPPEILSAKTVYIDNQSGIAKLGDRTYQQVTKWGRWQVVSDRHNADLILLLSAHEYDGGYVTTGGRTTGSVDGSGNVDMTTQPTYTRPVSIGYTYITVIDSKTGDTLWSDEKRWGNLYNGFHSASKGLIDELMKRIKEESKSTSSISPKGGNAALVQTVAEQPEPDCGATTEEDARREAIAWANKHPEYQPTPENAQKIIGYMETHRLCPTEQNFDTAYNAVRKQDADSNSAAGKAKPQLTVLMLGGRGGTFNNRFAVECPEIGMAFPSEREQPDFQFAVALVEQPTPAWILFRVPRDEMHVVLGPENEVESAVRRACNFIKKPETATWLPN